MSDPFIIYFDQLKEGDVQRIDTSLSSEFIDINETDLFFKEAVKVSGEAYVTDDDFVLHLNASTSAEIPCSVCNRLVSIPLAIKGYYHTEPLADIKSPFFDFRGILRELLLVELPKVAECRGNCPEREALASFLRKEAKADASTHYFPFNDLKLS